MRRQVAKVVAPKRAKLAEAEGDYTAVMAGLQEKQAELQVRAFPPRQA
jgi:dynein heavy chain